MELGVTDPVPALDTPAVAHQLQQGFWGGAQACEEQVRGVKGLGVTGAAGRDFHDPAGAGPGLGDVRMGLFRPQRPGDVAAVADLVIACHKRDVPLALELAADLAVQGLLISLDRQEEVGPLLLELPKNGRWVWSASAWMRTPSRSSSPSNCRSTARSWLPGGVAGLADRHPQSGRIQRDLGNERGAAAGGELDRASQGLAVTHQLIEISCATWDLGDCPVTNRSAQRRHVHLVEEVAERGVRWWPPQLQAECLGEGTVVADCKTLQIPQALAATQDSQHGHQQQIPGWKPNPTPHPRIRDRPQVADQVEINCGRSAVEHKEDTIPPTSTHADSPGKDACDGL